MQKQTQNSKPTAVFATNILHKRGSMKVRLQEINMEVQACGGRHTTNFFFQFWSKDDPLVG
jgi:hypothetical protein